MPRALVGLTLVAVIVVGGFLGAGDIRRSRAAEGPSVASALSTHVLDTASGRPVAGVPVRLVRDGKTLGLGKTDADGRLELGPAPLEAGTYQLIFDVHGVYPKSFYPEITVSFQIGDPAAHLHLPILLSPFGFTTYRGS
ncbi:hydroxyisourate hydrolase [Methyloceanibacter sp.]|uniref:hydroxyisourate hydrolase n=1 Tax=Methyloceanibacter sp. TaxID=1965321 RepID=UPI003D6D3DB3